MATPECITKQINRSNELYALSTRLLIGPNSKSSSREKEPQFYSEINQAVSQLTRENKNLKQEIQKFRKGKGKLSISENPFEFQNIQMGNVEPIQGERLGQEKQNKIIQLERELVSITELYKTLKRDYEKVSQALKDAEKKLTKRTRRDIQQQSTRTPKKSKILPESSNEENKRLKEIINENIQYINKKEDENIALSEEISKLKLSGKETSSGKRARIAPQQFTTPVQNLIGTYQKYFDLSYDSINTAINALMDNIKRTKSTSDLINISPIEGQVESLKALNKTPELLPIIITKITDKYNAFFTVILKALQELKSCSKS